MLAVIWSLIHRIEFGFGLRRLPLPLQLLSQILKLALFHGLCNVRVDIHGGVKVGMAEDFLDDFDVDAVLKQAGREGVPQGVAGEPGQQYGIL